MPSGDLESLKVPCPSCGHLNYPGRLICDSCGADLPKTLETPAPPPAPKERPGCVTAYAILLGFVGLAGLIYRDIGLLTAALSIVIAYGLWKLKNWARILLIIFASLETAILIFSWIPLAITGVAEYSYSYIPYSSDLTFSIFWSIGRLIVNIIVIWWFASHREYFD